VQISWSFEPLEIETVRAIVEERLEMGRFMLTYRWEHNVAGEPPDVTKSDMWFQHIMAMLSSQQRAGPGGPVDRFYRLKPFPLALERCRQADDVEKLAKQSLTDNGGIRFTSKLSRLIADNYDALENRDGWRGLLGWRDRLVAIRKQKPDPTYFDIETQAAQYTADSLKGLGPKQSRNFWQLLGLTRYSFVLDSRIMRWLQDNFDMPEGLMTPGALSDERYYVFISRMLLDLCDQAGVLPCMFDAAVFDSFDIEEWEVET
jgi:hypothetical protein